MPVTWDKAVYDQAYQRRIDGTRQPSYRRSWVPDDPDAHQSLVGRFANVGSRLPGFVPGFNVLVVGCGFGWTIEIAKDDFGHDRIWGTDISPWIQANLDHTGDLGVAQARSDIAPLIFDIDVTDPNARQLFQQGGAGQQGRFNWIVTEFVVESLDPATELQPFLDGCESLLRPNSRIAHVLAGKITDPGPDDVHDRSLGLEWRTLAEWVAERPSHYWLNVHGWELGGGT